MALIISKNQPFQFEPIPERCNKYDPRCYVPFFFPTDEPSYQVLYDGNFDGTIEDRCDQLLFNNSFASDPASGTLGHWTKGTGWTISGGAAVKTAGTASNLSQNTPLYGKLYEVIVAVTVTAGSIQVVSSDFPSITTTGTHTRYIFIDESTPLVNFMIIASSTFAGSISQIDLYELKKSSENHIIVDLDGNEAGSISQAITYNPIIIREDIDLSNVEPGCYKVQIRSRTGCNLIIDAGITSEDNWVFNADGNDGWFVSNNRADLVYVDTVHTLVYNDTISYLAGESFNFSFDYSTGAGSITFYLEDFVAGISIVQTVSGTGRLQINRTFPDNLPIGSGNLTLGFFPEPIEGAPFTGYIDNVFVRKNEFEVEKESNIFKVVDPAAICENCTLLIGFENENDFAGLYFTDGASFSPVFRVEAELKNPKYLEEGKRFVDSLGKRYALNLDSKQKWELHFQGLPEWMHNVVRIAKIADHFYIDGDEYSPEVDDYVPEWKGDLTIAPSRFDVLLKHENVFNGNC